MDGLSLSISFRSFGEMRGFLDRTVNAGVVRCLSPNREALCDDPAVMVFWQDQAEYYPCCNNHIEHGRQWTGSTRGNGYLSIPVIPDKARAWVEALEPGLRKRIKFDEYERGAD